MGRPGHLEGVRRRSAGGLGKWLEPLWMAGLRGSGGVLNASAWVALEGRARQLLRMRLRVASRLSRLGLDPTTPASIRKRLGNAPRKPYYPSD